MAGERRRRLDVARRQIRAGTLGHMRRSTIEQWLCDALNELSEGQPVLTLETPTVPSDAAHPDKDLPGGADWAGPLRIRPECGQ